MKSRNALRSSGNSRTSTKQPRRQESSAELQSRSLRHETIFAAVVAALFSVLAFGYCFPRNMLLLYGDAVAHLHICLLYTSLL